MGGYTLKQPIPVMQVRDVKVALEFYSRHFGFTDGWEKNGEYGGLSKDGMQVHFMQKGSPTPTMIYTLVEGVDSIYESVKRDGLEIAATLKDQPYGMREFTTRDPDGNYIAFTQPIES